jgi:hypothetical protein
MELAPHIHIASRLEMRGDLSSLPYASSLRGA